MKPPAPPLALVKRRVAGRYGAPPEDFVGRRAARAIVWPRHVAIYLARQLTGHSDATIAERFGRTHTAVPYAVRVVAGRMDEDPAVAAEIAALRDEIVATAGERGHLHLSPQDEAIETAAGLLLQAAEFRRAAQAQLDRLAATERELARVIQRARP